MPDKQSHIPSYSAAELMRYATGRMSTAEMHKLEKAALEDPFLAEALDGYMEVIATQPESNIQVQANRLNPITEKKEAVVIPLWQRKSVRAAIAALFIAGAGWTIFSLLQKPANPASGIVQQAPVAQPGMIDSLATVREVAPPPPPDSPMAYADRATGKKEAAPKPDPSAAAALGAIAIQQAQSTNDFTVSVAPYNLQRATGSVADTAASTPDVAMRNAEMEALQEKKDALTTMRKQQAPDHFFKAQITDVKNNPVPYANIMIEGQNFGTYSDAAGRFNFISDDSVLQVRVRSVGYTNQTIALQDKQPETRIVLQEDQQLASNLPLTVQSRNKMAAPVQKSIIERDSIIGLEASTIQAPYYDLYLLNNNRISPQPKLNRQVELSFEVSKTGEATNITVIKSSGGKALDDEAVRLVKEGPKLNTEAAAGKKKKVTVQF